MIRSLYLRLLSAAAVWITAALVFTGVVVSNLLHDFVEQSFESRLAATLVGIMAAVSFDNESRLLLARPVVEPQFDQVLSGWYWQVADGEQVLIGSRSLWNEDLGIDAGRTAGTPRRAILVGPKGETLHALWRDFSIPESDMTLRVTVAAPRAEIDAAVGAIVPPIVWSLAILGLGLGAAVLAQVHFGLRPLNRVRQNLSAIRQGRLEQLPAETQMEIAPLVREINGLIKHNKEVIERARTHVRNLAHRMKTPLSVLGNEIGRPGRDPEGVMAGCVEMMERQIQYHLRRARTAATRDLVHARTALGPVAEDVLSAMRCLHRTRQLDIALHVEGEPVFAGEQQDLEEMLGNLLDNACKWAASRIIVTCYGENAAVTIVIADDGPGMPSAAAAEAHDRAQRQDPQTPGIGIAIVEEIAGLYGGGVRYGRADIGGLEVRLTLPAIQAQRTPA